MAWITITKRWNCPLDGLRSMRYLPGRYNVTADVAEAAKGAGVVAAGPEEAPDGKDDG